MKVAVIGTRGYIGRHLCQEFEQLGMECLAYSSGNSNGISLTTGLLPVDFSFPVGLDAVFFLAQSPHYRQMPEFSAHLVSVNCVAATQAAEAARRAGVRKFIYASTGNVYAPSFSPLSEAAPVRRDNWYSLSKVMAEDALALYRPALDITCARIFGVYGPEQDGKLVSMIANAVSAGKEIFLDANPHDSLDLDGLKISLMYIDDLVRSLIELVDVAECPVVNLAGDEAISIRRLAVALGVATGQQTRLCQGTKMREGDLVAETSLSRKLFGAQRVDFASGIERVVAVADSKGCNAH